MANETRANNSSDSSWITGLATNHTGRIPATDKAIRFILSVLDLTSLGENDTPSLIQQLCRKAVHPVPCNQGMPQVAAVCVYPQFVQGAREILRNTGIRIATVAGAFPTGEGPINKKLGEVSNALLQGADEIDFVIDYKEFLRGDKKYINEEVAQAKRLCGDKMLKVILETGAFGSSDNIRAASEVAIAAGADFLKTSTGKINPAATIPAARVMMEVIKEHYQKSGVMVGIKVAGGISSLNDAVQYLALLHEVLGEKWFTPDYFRIGASRLVDEISSRLGSRED
jgi:deoxyribose-phosphate aldolase